MTDRHTPGPLRVDEGSDGARVIEAAPDATSGGLPRLIATVHPLNGGQQIYNARLFAAAPLMLDALHIIAGMCCLEHAQIEAREAIAQATGETA